MNAELKKLADERKRYEEEGNDNPFLQKKELQSIARATLEVAKGIPSGELTAKDREMISWATDYLN